MSRVRALLLAAGLGTRLRPLTDHCPKCLIPVLGRPLLEYWLCALYKCGIREVLINLHHHRDLVEEFIERNCFSGWVQGVVEDELLGTAGTLRENGEKLSSSTTFLAHADNWCQCDLVDFLDFHNHRRPADTLISMMTFRTSTPTTCGIVEINDYGVVDRLYEKVVDPPGNLANGAVYLLEPEVLQWVEERSDIHDFSLQVLPQFLGRIATWENVGIHRDIGVPQSLFDAQRDPQPELCWPEVDEWTRKYQNNSVHEKLISAMAAA